MFVTRRSRTSTRMTIWKVALLFLGAGIWIAGMLIENYQITAAAIIVIAIALLLGLVERGGGESETEEDGGEMERE
ncbi:hypothetical protein BH23GEM8_BH23GEM8_17870 [soil metagenome]